MLLQFRHLLKCLAETIYPSCKHNISRWKPSVGHSFIQIPSWGQWCKYKQETSELDVKTTWGIHQSCIPDVAGTEMWSSADMCRCESVLFTAAFVSLRDGDVKQLHDNPSYRTHKDNPYLCGCTLCRDMKLWKLRSWSYLSIIQMCYPSLCAILEPAAWLIVKRLRSQFNHSRNLICKWQWFACVY